jgi:hypothetical protein
MPHDTPPYPFMPSPTSAHSSLPNSQVFLAMFAACSAPQDRRHAFRNRWKRVLRRIRYQFSDDKAQALVALRLEKTIFDRRFASEFLLVRESQLPVRGSGSDSGRQPGPGNALRMR